MIMMKLVIFNLLVYFLQGIPHISIKILNYDFNIINI
jgi:hypothetical protein